jgi:hypothetical protein
LREENRRNTIPNYRGEARVRFQSNRLGGNVVLQIFETADGKNKSIQQP